MSLQELSPVNSVSRIHERSSELEAEHALAIGLNYNLDTKKLVTACCCTQSPNPSGGASAHLL